MGVQFFAELGPIVGHKVTCHCDTAVGETFTDRDVALARFVELRDAGEPVEGCTDEFCLVMGPHVLAMEADPSPVVDATSTNARHLLETLGILDEDLVGGEDAQTFLGRVLVALGLSPADAGVPATDGTLPGRTTPWIHLGRPEGYTEARMEQLRELAEFGVRTGREIVWA